MSPNFKNKPVFLLWKTFRPPPILHPKRLAELVQAIDAAILRARRAGLGAEGMAEGHKPLRQLLRAQRGPEMMGWNWPPVDTLWWTNMLLWKDPPFLMGKSTINSHVPLVSNLSSLSFQSASRSLDAIKVSFMNIPGMAGMGPPS